MTFRKEAYRKIVLFLFALTLIITAFEDAAVYVDVRVFNLVEVGKTVSYISVHGLDMGLLLSFVHSTSLAFLAVFYCLVYFRFSDSIPDKRKLLKDYAYFFFVLAFVTLGAMSLMNLPAAINDFSAPAYGGGPLTSIINLLTIIFFLIGALISILFISHFERKERLERISLS